MQPNTWENSVPYSLGVDRFILAELRLIGVIVDGVVILLGLVIMSREGAVG